MVVMMVVAMVMVMVMLMVPLHVHLFGPKDETEDEHHLCHNHPQRVERRVPV